MISDDESEMKVGSVFGTVKQRTEFRLEDKRSMMDLSVDGLETVDSVGGWLRADGALVVGQSPGVSARVHMSFLRVDVVGALCRWMWKVGFRFCYFR